MIISNENFKAINTMIKKSINTHWKSLSRQKKIDLYDHIANEIMMYDLNNLGDIDLDDSSDKTKVFKYILSRVYLRGRNWWKFYVIAYRFPNYINKDKFKYKKILSLLDEDELKLFNKIYKLNPTRNRFELDSSFPFSTDENAKKLLEKFALHNLAYKSGTDDEVSYSNTSEGEEYSDQSGSDALDQAAMREPSIDDFIEQNDYSQRLARVLKDKLEFNDGEVLLFKLISEFEGKFTELLDYLNQPENEAERKFISNSLTTWEVDLEMRQFRRFCQKLMEKVQNNRGFFEQEGLI